MDKSLSILNSQIEPDLVSNRSDAVATLLKGIVGATPVVGNLLAETLTQLIPNQRLDRVAECLAIFSSKVDSLDAAFLQHKMQTEEFADLLQDVVGAAARALSPERKEYLAALLKNSITREDLDHLGHKKILGLLNELNDAEIIIVKYHSIPDQDVKWEFQTLHSNVISGYTLPPDASQQERDRHLMFKQNHDTIERLKLNVTDGQGYNLGRLLLQYIDLA